MPASPTDATFPVELPHTGDGAVIAAEGNGLMATPCAPVAVQPSAVCTVTPSSTEPLEPAVKVIERVPVPAVIVPLLTAHV